MKQTLASLVTAAALISGVGACTVHGEVEGPSVAVEDEPPAPPPTRVVYAPRPGYIWIEGRYERRGPNWVWTEGRYENERRGHVYVQGRWEVRGRRRVWVGGHWR